MPDDDARQTRIRLMQRDLAAVFTRWQDVDRATQLRVLRDAAETVAGELRRELWGTFGRARRP